MMLRPARLSGCASRCQASVEAALGELDCIATFEVSLEGAGARVEYLAGYLYPDDIVSHLEAETYFTVTCQEEK